MLSLKKMLLFIGLLSTTLSFSCLNYYYSLDEHGTLHNWGEDYFRGFNQNFNTPLINKKLKSLAVDIEKNKSPFLLSDYAVL